MALIAAQGGLDARVQIVAIVVTAVMLGVVLELVRRRRLVERYALLWMVVALALLVVAIWNQLLSFAADRLGIEVPSNFLFLAAFAVAFLLLLHFSIITSRLSEETKILAQEVARLDERLRNLRRSRNGDQPDDEGADLDTAPSSTRTSSQ
jgi:hypothetical protein